MLSLFVLILVIATLADDRNERRRTLRHHVCDPGEGRVSFPARILCFITICSDTIHSSLPFTVGK